MSAEKKEEKTVAIRVEMPDDLRNRFKSVVVREGKNMKDVIVEFVEEYVEEKEKQSKWRHKLRSDRMIGSR